MDSNKIRVLQLGKYYHPYNGGIESVSLELSKSLNNEKVLTDVICLSRGDFKETIPINYDIFRCKTNFAFGSLDFSIEYIKSLKKVMDSYDIIHIHMPNPMAHLAVLFCQPKSKIVLHWHGDIIGRRLLKFLYRPFLKQLIRKADAVIGATPAHIEESDFSPEFKGKSHIIPYIYDYHATANKMVNAPEVACVQNKYGNKKIVFTIGRHVYYKGFADLIQSALYLPDDWVVVIAGDGPDTKALKKQILRLKVEHKVYLTGRLSEDELLHHLDACKVFAFPSIYRSEMFGMVQLEAFSRSKPVISTNIPRSGVRYVNNHGVSGLHVPVKSPKKLASAIQEVVDGESYSQFCLGAQEWLRSKFELKDLVRKHISLYDDMMKNSE